MDVPGFLAQKAVNGIRAVLVVSGHFMDLPVKGVFPVADAAWKGDQDIALPADLIFCPAVTGDDVLRAVRRFAPHSAQGRAKR